MARSNCAAFFLSPARRLAAAAAPAIHRCIERLIGLVAAQVRRLNDCVANTLAHLGSVSPRRPVALTCRADRESAPGRGDWGVRTFRVIGLAGGHCSSSSRIGEGVSGV